MTSHLLLTLLLLQGVAPQQSRPGILAGRLLLQDGEPASGFRVAALEISDTYDRAGAQALLGVTQTDDNGRFFLTNLPPGRYVIVMGSVSSPLYYPGVATLPDATVVTVTSGSTTSDLLFSMPKDGVATGRILKTDGKPAAGIRVSAVAQMEPSEMLEGAVVLASITQTDNSGNYRLENIRPGRYTIMAGKIDFPTYYPGGSEPSMATLVTIASGSATDGLDFTLERSSGVSVSGRVADLSGASALPLDAFSVVMEGPESLSVPINADGTFEFPIVPRGTYTAQLVPLLTLFGARRVVIAGDRDVSGIELGPLYETRGRGIVDNGSSLPLPGYMTESGGSPNATTLVRVEARRGSTIQSTVVRADGAFTLSLRAGEYWIWVTGLPFGYYLKSTTYGSLDLMNEPLKISGPLSSNIVFTLTTTPPDSAPPTVKVRGRVAGLSEIGTPGRLSVSMRPAGEDTDSSGGDVALNPDGTFEFQGVPSGTYLAYVSGTGVDPSSSAGVIVKDQDVSGVALPLRLRIDVSGRVNVFDEKGRAIPELPQGVTIHFSGPDGVRSADVRANGTFEITLPGGDHAISLKLPSRAYAVRSIVSGPADLLKAPLRIGTAAPMDLRITVDFKPATAILSN